MNAIPNTLTIEEMEALEAAAREGETSQPEATIFIAEDAEDHIA